jgi:thiosulfate/3-mercaptopyruvate sulfurtransferase
VCAKVRPGNFFVLAAAKRARLRMNLQSSAKMFSHFIFVANQVMKKMLAVFLSLLFLQKANAQNPTNWTKDQLLEPAELAKTIAANKDIPLIYSVGPGALIPRSVVIGMTNDEKNLAAFKKQLSTTPKGASIVVYCGCCPFEHCPNIRPAINALKELHFTNYKLLNLSQNIKADWIDKGYPLKEK